MPLDAPDRLLIYPLCTWWPTPGIPKKTANNITNISTKRYQE
jgi:hypothetical protein